MKDRLGDTAGTVRHGDGVGETLWDMAGTARHGDGVGETHCGRHARETLYGKYTAQKDCVGEVDTKRPHLRDTANTNQVRGIRQVQTRSEGCSKPRPHQRDTETQTTSEGRSKHRPRQRDTASTDHARGIRLTHRLRQRDTAHTGRQRDAAHTGHVRETRQTQITEGYDK